MDALAAPRWNGAFFLGFSMLIIGGYLFLNAIHVSYGFSMGHHLFSVGQVRLTGGMVLVPFIFGIGMVFYNSKNPTGWCLTVASLGMLAFGVITSIDMRLKPMSAFELITILVLMIGGLGLFLRSLKDYNTANQTS